MKKVLLAFFLLTGVASAQQLDSLYRSDIRPLSGSIRVQDSSAILARVIMPVQGVIDSVGWLGHNRDGVNDTVLTIVYLNSGNLPTTWLDSGLVRTVVTWSDTTLSRQALTVKPTRNAGDTLWFGIFLLNASTNGEVSISHVGGAATGQRHAFSAATAVRPPSTITCIGYDAAASNLPQMTLYYHTLTGGEGTLIPGGAVYGG